MRLICIIRYTTEAALVWTTETSLHIIPQVICSKTKRFVLSIPRISVASLSLHVWPYAFQSSPFLLQDCCEKHFSWTSECLDASDMADEKDEQNGSTSLFYPLFDGEGSCVNDGNQPSYYSPSDMFDNKEVSVSLFTIWGIIILSHCWQLFGSKGLL